LRRDSIEIGRRGVPSAAGRGTNLTVPSIDATFSTAQTATVHGRAVSYLEAGDGPLLLLVHGMAGTARNWEAVIDPLALRNTVVAPDFPGHGESAPGGGDYSLGGLAGGLRDLMLALGHERATLVGHSLGGGVALQFTYQFPEMVERLALVSSGGLGPEVGMILRAAALPGADLFIRATSAPGAAVTRKVTGALGKLGLRPNADLAEVGRAYATLSDADRRKAFLSTLHAVVGTEGQRVAALDRLYLAEDLPILIVWGESDPIIPAAHGRAAHAQLPGSRLEVFPGVGHIPQLEDPGRFAAVLQRFLEDTEPAEFDGARWRARFSGR
jgi:pimeloyl-ACP methyl ester carboxylesterase